ncbi:epididymal-specific lipocalin-12 isoform 2-T2 [Thomomys bottae]
MDGQGPGSSSPDPRASLGNSSRVEPRGLPGLLVSSVTSPPPRGETEAEEGHPATVKGLSLPDPAQALAGARVKVQLDWTGQRGGVGLWAPARPSPAPQFQGEWFVLGLAGNNYKKEDRAVLRPFITTITLSDNGRLQVSSAMRRGKRCDIWSYVMVPTAQSGKFTVESKGPTTTQEDMLVMDTDYTKFALMLSLKPSGSGRTVIRVSLLGHWTGLAAWPCPRASRRKTSHSQI